MRKRSSNAGATAIELVEEAAHLLRSASATAHGVYAAGTLPFVLGLLYFWADMSRGAYARSHAGSSAIGMASLYVWMKCWQAAYASSLRDCWTARSPKRWNVTRIGKLILAQVSIQPSSLIAVPVSFVIALPFVWIFSFYQNVTVSAADNFEDLSALSRKAARQASLLPGQAHFLAGIVAVFALFVWMNIVAAMIAIPSLMKSLIGIETAFSRANGAAFFNTTFFACSLALAYVCVDPLIKAIYVLRCFYADSIATGEDLKVELAQASAAASSAPTFEGHLEEVEIE